MDSKSYINFISEDFSLVQSLYACEEAHSLSDFV